MLVRASCSPVPDSSGGTFNVLTLPELFRGSVSQSLVQVSSARDDVPGSYLAVRMIAYACKRRTRNVRNERPRAPLISTLPTPPGTGTDPAGGSVTQGIGLVHIEPQSPINQPVGTWGPRRECHRRRRIACKGWMLLAPASIASAPRRNRLAGRNAVLIRVTPVTSGPRCCYPTCFSWLE